MGLKRGSYSGVLAAAFVAVVVAACGSRTGLLVDESTSQPKSALFCLHNDYAAGFGDVSLYVMLDASGSMNDDQKWDLVTAALSAFVDDPRVSGLEVGLQYLPLGASCDSDDYARPAVPLAALPGNAAPIKRSLAQHATPDGTTPLLPALAGSIEYARARMQAEPTRAVVIALVTDGNPDTCDSTPASVATIAAAGVSSDPQVLTFVIGLETGVLASLNRIAAAGGTGKPILIGKDPSSAQQIVESLRALRDAARYCRYSVPSAPSAQPTANDLSVTYRAAPDAKPTSLPLVASASDCGSGDGFFADDAAHPTLVTLCGASCAALHARAGSRATVTAGCGLGAPDGGAIRSDAGNFCSGVNSVYCVPACGSSDTSTPPVCVGTDWTCPAGTISLDTCNTCPPVPHGCCKSDGTLEKASCVNRAWVCPPGSTSFGSAGCKPPAVCAPLMPCAAGQYCKVPDFTCGGGNVPGACAPIPGACTPGGPAVCGCDGLSHPSACDAASGGNDVSASGACTEPTGTFACGPLFCRIADQICRHTNDLTKLIAPHDYACLEATAACPTGCGCGACGACPSGRSCKEACTTGATGGRMLTCARL